MQQIYLYKKKGKKMLTNNLNQDLSQLIVKLTTQAL